MVRYRALLSVLLVAGFYVIALVELVAFAVLTWELTRIVPSLVALQVTQSLLVAVVAGAGVALWRAIRARNEPAPGIVLHDEPRLTELVRELAVTVGTRPPDEIRLVTEVNASVSETTRWLGLGAGRRYLYIGLPLLATFTRAQLVAVLAHELGHYSNAHTRYGGMAYRARLAVSGTLSRINRRNPAGWGFAAYGLLYLLLDNSVSRRQELAADAAAVRLAGRKATISALSEIDRVAVAFGHFISGYAQQGQALGYAPQDLFARFAEFYRLRRVDVAVAEEPRSAWETHPPLPERIAAIEALPEGETAGGRERAIALLDKDYGPELAAVLFPGAKALPWTDFTAVVATAELQSQVDYLLREQRRRSSARTVPELVALLEPDALALVFALAAVRSNVATWEPSWHGPALLTDLDGDPLPLGELANLDLAEATERLHKLGVDLWAVRLQDEKASARGAKVVGGLGNVKLDGALHDMLVLDLGLIAVPTDGDSDDGNDRMRALMAEASLEELARRHRFLPFEEIRRTTMVKRAPMRVLIEFSDGKSVELRETWTGDQLVRGSSQNLYDVLKRFA